MAWCNAAPAVLRMPRRRWRLPDGLVPGGISRPADSQSAVNCTLNTKGAALRQRLLKGLNVITHPVDRKADLHHHLVVGLPLEQPRLQHQHQHQDQEARP